MIKKLTLSLVATAFLSSTLFAKADEELVDTYMQVSGLTQELENMSTQIPATIKQTRLMYGKK